jgi:hypothetical protein
VAKCAFCNYTTELPSYQDRHVTKSSKTKNLEFELFGLKISNCHQFSLKPVLLIADLYVYFERELISDGLRDPKGH